MLSVEINIQYAIIYYMEDYVTIKSKDGKTFTPLKKVANQSPVLRAMLSNDGTHNQQSRKKLIASLHYQRLRETH